MKIKQTIILLIISSITMYNYVSARQHGYVIKAEFAGLPNGSKVYLITQEKDTINKSISQGNKFSFNGNLTSEGRFYFIQFDSSLMRDPTSAIFLTNSTLYVYGRIGNADLTIIGSEYQEEYSNLQKIFKNNSEITKGLWVAYNTLNALYNSYSNKLDTNTAYLFKKEANVILDSIRIRQEYFQNSFYEWTIKNNHSMISAYSLNLTINNSKANFIKIDSIYNILTPKVKTSYYGQILGRNINVKKTANNFKNDSIIPNFSVLTTTGDTIKIYEVIRKNKLTLIDCWASWCKPCRLEVPNLKQAYDSLKNKGVNIIGISSDAKNEHWIKAIKEDNTLWAHFRELTEKNLLTTFGIKSIPAYILVDDELKIVAFSCSMSSIKSYGGSLRGEELINTINQHLNKQ